MTASEWRQTVINRIHAEIEPKLDMRPTFVSSDSDVEVGYDCCGCSTYRRIVLDVLELLNTTPTEDE
jgi:hypothetical protein